MTPSKQSMELKFKRVQSPSSINTYKQCPRKYYYQYIEKLETLPSIHLLRGKITHSVLESFFRIPPSSFSKSEFKFEMKIILIDLLNREWFRSLKLLNSLGLTEVQLRFYMDETRMMLMNWLNGFISKIEHEMKKHSLAESFKKLTPITEREYHSEKHGVHGFIDAIHDIEGEVTLMDYKTSKDDTMSPPYKLQLAIYALLYAEKHGKAPNKVGINFLKHGEKLINVDKEILDYAAAECELIHINTATDNVTDYPKRESALCKWHSGQCDFYDVCSRRE